MPGLLVGNAYILNDVVSSKKQRKRGWIERAKHYTNHCGGQHHQLHKESDSDVIEANIIQKSIYFESNCCVNYVKCSIPT